MGKNNAYLPNLEPLIAAGINPKTGLPVKIGGTPCFIKDEVKKELRIIDEQDAINRYTWYNLPLNLTSQEVERMLYYKGQLCFFYNAETDEFYFMPYALDGTIDFYGRYNRIHPVPMTSGEDNSKEQYKKLEDLLSQKKLNCIYGVMNVEDLDEDVFTKSCVLLHDYSKQLSQTIIPRQILNDPLLDVMAECIPFMRTSLILGTGIKGIRVNDADQADSVNEGSKSLLNSALTGNPWVPITGNIEFQELTDGQVAKADEFMLAMQSLDNFRLSTYGIDNGGLFEKKVQELQAEAAINGGPVGLVLQDGLSIRQNFCNIVNSIWGIGIWCEPSETIIGMDTNGDGVAYDENTGERSGTENDSVNDGGENND